MVRSPQPRRDRRSVPNPWHAGRVFMVALILVSAGHRALPARGDDAVDFARDVRPILADRCFQCHGADKQESGLRLDSGAAITAGGNSGAAIVPGKADESLLIRAVTGADDVSKMPPKGEPLSATEIDLLRRWLDAGA